MVHQKKWNKVNRLRLRLFLLISLTLQPLFLHGSDYDTDLLTIFSKLLPRIIMMSSLKPAPDTPVNICLVHHEMQRSVADGFEAMLIRNNVIRKIQITHADFGHLSGCKAPQLLFLFEAPPQAFAQTLDQITALGAMAAAYDPHRLAQGADISLFVGRSVVPYVNLQTLLEKNIRLKPLLLRVSKIYAPGSAP